MAKNLRKGSRVKIRGEPDRGEGRVVYVETQEAGAFGYSHPKTQQASVIFDRKAGPLHHDYLPTSELIRVRPSRRARAHTRRVRRY